MTGDSFGGCIRLAAACLALASTPPGVAKPADNAREAVGFYIQAYGVVLPQDNANVARAYEVFERVRAAANVSGLLRTNLVVTAADDATLPMALALADGNIVLTSRGINVCHQGHDAATAQACLAFVLGHELAHLAHDDLLNREVFGLLPDADAAAKDLADKTRELSADNKGFIYAAMAGYRVDALLNSTTLLETWMQPAGEEADDTYPDVETRAELARQRLSAVMDELVLFDFGVRLSLDGNCHDALYFLKSFQKKFPGSAVLNAIGYCYLQLAHNELDPSVAAHYWMPLLADNRSRLSEATRAATEQKRSLGASVGEPARSYLLEAIPFLERAGAVDPTYVPARQNLGAAWLYLGSPHRARAVLGEALQLEPDNALLRTLDALALFEQSEARVDLWPEAVDRLRSLAHDDRQPVPPHVLYNLARLLEFRGRGEEARQYWNHLGENGQALPASIRRVVCMAQTRQPVELCLEDSTARRSVATWPWPINADQMARADETLRGWRGIDFDFYHQQLRGRVYRSVRAASEVLILDNFVYMQVLKNPAVQDPDRLRDYCPHPPMEKKLPDASLFSCNDWSAVVQNDRITQVWKVNR